MSRASGNLTGRSSRTSSRNKSRQGTIHAENPELLNKLLKGDDTTPPPEQQQGEKSVTKSPSRAAILSSKHNTPRETAASTVAGGKEKDEIENNVQNSDVISGTTPRKVADKVKFAPELGPAEDSGTENSPKESERRGTKKEVDDRGGGAKEEKDADSGHYEGNEYVLASDDPPPQNNANDDTQNSGLEKREGTFTETSPAPPKKDNPSPDIISNSSETYRKEPDDNNKDLKLPDSDKDRTTSANTENPEPAINNNSVPNTDNQNNNSNDQTTLARNNSDLDRQTLKSTNSFNSELARLHSPSRKSLNIDQEQQLDNNNEEPKPDNSNTTAPAGSGSQKPEPAYSVGSPRQSKASFREGNNGGNSQSLSQELKLKLKLEDPSQNRSTAPYSSQRLKPQGDLAKRTTSVRSENVPVESVKESPTPIDSLEIEKDSLDLDAEEEEAKTTQNKSPIEETNTNNKNTTQEKDTSTSETKQEPATKEHDNYNFSADSLSNSVDDNTTNTTPINVTSDDGVKDNRKSPEFLKERSDTQDTLVDEHVAVESVGQIEKYLGAPVTNRTSPERNRNEPVDPPVEFVIRSEPGSRYSSSIPNNRRDANSYTNLQYAPVHSSSTPPRHSGGRRLSGATPSRKKVYIDSPTFSKEEEGEYRFVKSRLDDIELEDSTKYNTFRELDTFDVERKEKATPTKPTPVPGKMPEKRVRYSDLDNEYREKELAILEGRGGGGGGRGDGMPGPPRGAGGGYAGNEHSSSNDESDKENRRRILEHENRHQEQQRQQQQQQQRFDPNNGGGGGGGGGQYALSTHNNHPPANSRAQPLILPNRHDTTNPPYPDNNNKQRNAIQAIRDQGGHGPDGHMGSHMHHGYEPNYMSNNPPRHSHSNHHSNHQQQPPPHHNPILTPPPQQQQQPKPHVRGLSLPTGPTYDPEDENDLEQELSYQQSLKSRIDSGNRQAERSVIPPLHLQQSEELQPHGQGYHQQHQQQQQQYYNDHLRNDNGAGQSFAQDSLDYDTEDTARNYFYQNAGVDTQGIPIQSQNVHHHHLQGQGQQQQQQQQQYNPNQHVTDEDRYEDRDDYNSDYEHARGQRSNNPHVQPRFFNPNHSQDYNYQQHQQQQPPLDNNLNTDRSEMSMYDNNNKNPPPPPPHHNPHNYGYTNNADDNYNNYNYDDNNNDQDNNNNDGDTERGDTERMHHRRNKFYDKRDNDENMEAVHPSPPKYDYINHNKGDYGKTPQKSYKRIHEISKEEKEKLETAFIQPKPKPKGGVGGGGGILKKRAGSQNSLNSIPSQSSRGPGGHPPPPGPPPHQYHPGAQQQQQGQQPYVQQQHSEMTQDSGMSAAEEVWARRASTLASRLDGKGKKKKGGHPPPGLQKYNSDSAIDQVSGPNQGYQQLRQAHNQYYQPPPPQQQQQQQQQIHQSQHAAHHRHPPPPQQQQHHQQHQQQPPPPSQQQQQQQKAPPRDGRAFLTDMPTPVNEHHNNQGSIPITPRQEFQLSQPVTQQIVTEDGQRISVDVNLKLISPPPSLHQHQQQQQHHHHQQQQPPPQYDQYDSRTQHQQQQPRQYPAAPTHYADEIEEEILAGAAFGGSGYAKMFGDGYSYASPRDRERYSADDALRALTNSRTATNPYGKIPPIHRPYDYEGRENVPNSAPAVGEEAGSYMDAFVKQKRQEEKPWYKVYNLKDFRRMKKEVHLGTLGPDLDSDILRERKEKAQRQSEYAKNVMSKNKTVMVGKKPPTFPRPREQDDDIMNRRKVAVEYAKSVPKPTVKPRPTEYNNYELASEKSPIAKVHNNNNGARKPAGNKAGSKQSSQMSSPTHSHGGKGGAGGGGVVDKDIEELDLARMRQRYEEDKHNESVIRKNTGSVSGSRGYYGDS